MSSQPATIGRYQIERRLGQGGMGALYLAIDPALGRRLAIKLLLSDDSDELRERFTREARAAAQLSHRNIVSVYDVGEHEGRPFIAMEYVEGRTLGELIRARAPLSVSNQIEILDELCAALAHAHQHGIVHRDIKPANVMIDATGTVKVLDFGIARIGGSNMTRAGFILGSPNYMAPEQVEGRETDARADIFAVGALSYELLALRPPFMAPDTMGVLWKIVHGAPDPLASVVPGIDSELAAIVERAMAHEPDRRYQNLDEMRADLRRVKGRIANDLHVEGAAAVAVDVKTVAGLRAASTLAGVPAPQAEAVESPASETGYLAVGDAQLPSDRMPAVQLLVVRSGDSRMNGRVVPVATPSFAIGRDSACELPIADALLSRRHATITFGSGGFVVHDGGSANGTFLNGRRVKATGEPLTFGATLQMGQTAVKFALSNDVNLPDLTGTTVASRYQLTRLLREGAKGVVYEALDQRMGKSIALKLMSPELMRFDAYRQQFEREAGIGATLHHPHICQVLDRGEDVVQSSGRSLRLTYLCAQMMAGGSLSRRMQDGPIPLAEIAVLVERVGEALDYAHRHGVVHGDVKPSAIVFSEDGHVYLTDFAFAQSALNTGDGPALGSPAYVAPEVWDHGALTTATDQFALAVVAYYAIAGSLPFAGQEDPVARRKHLALGAVAAHQEASSYRQEAIPRAVSEVLARGFAPAPDRRFESPGAFAVALADALKGRRPDRSTAHIFLSYQRDMSSGWANYFAKELKDHGIATFLDVQRLDRAQLFPQRLSRAIEECDVFVCLLAKTTLQSAWVVEEIRQAFRHGKPMIPIFQESFDPAAARDADSAVDALLSYDAVHLFDLRNVHIQHSAADLAALVKNTIDRRSGS